MCRQEKQDISTKLSIFLSQQTQTDLRPHQRMTCISDNQDDSHRQIHTHSLSSVAHTDSWTPSVMSHPESASPISHISPLTVCLVPRVCKRRCLYRSSLPERECCWTSSYTEPNTEEHQCPAFGSGKRRRGRSGEQSGGANRGLNKSGEGIMCVYLSGRQTRFN